VIPPTLWFQALFGGVGSQLGWIFFGFGLIFVWGFMLHSEVVTFAKFHGPMQHAQGAVIRSHKTGAEENDTPIYAITYEFTPANSSERISGISYTTGEDLSAGTTVTVEYKANNPQISRIQGMRTAEFGSFVLIALLFPLIGLIFIIGRIRYGLRAIAMMMNGQPAVSSLVSLAETNVKENKRRVYRATFRFTALDGKTYSATVNTTNPEDAWWSFRDGAPTDAPRPDAPQEIVLYHPADPAASFIPAAFGPNIQVDEQGNITGDNPLAGVAATIIPLLVIGGHLWYIMHFLK
jgi:hypothetical protein